MAARGWGLFSLYIYKENLKNLLVRNQWTNFNITWQECFFDDPLPRLFKPSWFVKNVAARGWGLFSLYIYIEKFKNLLVRNSWTEFNVTWQECCFGDLLPRLFKLSCNHIIIGFLINGQVQGQHPHQWAPFQIAGLLHAWQISHQISRYVYHEGW